MTGWRERDKDRRPSQHEPSADSALAGLHRALVDATTTDEFAHVLETFIASFGFSTATLVTVPRTTPGPASYRPLTQTLTKFWQQAGSRGFPQSHALWSTLSTATAPVSWSLASTTDDKKPRPRGLAAIAERHDIANVLFVPVAGPTHDAAFIALTAGRSTITGHPGQFEAIVSMAATVVFHRLALIDGHARRDEHALTRREAEIARWIAAGKSDWEIGKILNISAKTVNYYAENLKRKCGVATRVQAIVALYGPAWLGPL